MLSHSLNFTFSRIAHFPLLIDTITFIGNIRWVITRWWAFGIFVWKRNHPDFNRLRLIVVWGERKHEPSKRRVFPIDFWHLRIVADERQNIHSEAVKKSYKTPFLGCNCYGKHCPGWSLRKRMSFYGHGVKHTCMRTFYSCAEVVSTQRIELTGVLTVPHDGIRANLSQAFVTS